MSSRLHGLGMSSPTHLEVMSQCVKLRKLLPHASIVAVAAPYAQ